VKDPLETIDVDSRRAITYVVLAAAAFVVLGIAKPNVLGTIAVILAFFVMIILHEFGHFVMAKRAGMKVTEFFVGFGPRVWSFRKGETEYGLKAFPLGGYCRIIGMTNIEEVEPEDEPRAYRSKRFLPKLGVALAGSTMHFLIALVLIFVVLVAAGDVFTNPTASTVVHDVNGPAATAMIRRGDKIVAVAGQPVATWDEAVSVIQKRPGQTVPIVVERLGEKVTVNVHLDTHRPDETARRWRYRDGGGEIGVIASVTQPFCGGCSRARLSAEGRLHTCLFATKGHDLRGPLRLGASDEELAGLLRGIWSGRTDRYSELRSAETAALPKVEMSYIGG
jgi:hypothetical protein